MWRKGFTLIEVLIVLIIIGILSTLLMPQIGGMIERARTAEAMGVLGAMRSALMVYYMERTTPTFPTAATTTGEVETRLGEIVDASKSLFNYNLGTPSGNTTTAVARRNDRNIQGNKWAEITMTVNGDGSATIATTWLSTTETADT